jgi:hypothetical protein
MKNTRGVNFFSSCPCYAFFCINLAGLCVNQLSKGIKQLTTWITRYVSSVQTYFMELLGDMKPYVYISMVTV